MSSDLHRAMYSHWRDNGLDDKFNSKWTAVNRSQHQVLHDTEAGPATPMPYCVFREDPPTVVTRMSGHSTNDKHHIRDSMWNYTIHARTTTTQSAKEVCDELLKEILKVFGGHPTVQPPDPPALPDGNILLFQYQTDFGQRTGDDEYSWIVRYIVRIDVPVAA